MNCEYDFVSFIILLITFAVCFFYVKKSRKEYKASSILYEEYKDYLKKD